MDMDESILFAKKNAAIQALDYIKHGMIVGLGTGTTAAFFIDALAKRVHEGLKISAVASSLKSMEQAKQLKIPLEDPENIFRIDIVIDGADEIDHKKNMIKGGGGALLREKLVAKASKEMIVIIDETKLVSHLGKFPVAVEIIPFLHQFTFKELQKLGLNPILRKNHEGGNYLTDNGNYIFDISFDSPIYSPYSEHEKLKAATGVVETGFFFNLATHVIVGYKNGTTNIF